MRCAPSGWSLLWKVEIGCSWHDEILCYCYKGTSKSQAAPTPTKFWWSQKRNYLVRVIPVSQVYGGTRNSNPGDSVLLTQENGNGKKSITVDQLRQRRLGGSIQENSDDEVLNQENLAEGFFFAF
jgi:hypothetical protein